MGNYYEDSGFSPAEDGRRGRGRAGRVIALVLCAVVLVGAVLGGVAAVRRATGQYIDVITVSGTISGQTSGGLFDTVGYDHQFLLGAIDKLMNDRTNRGILLAVDSPGGSVYETDELYLKLMEYKEQTGRPVYAFFGAEAASGGYYVAMAADHIVANRNCMTGSIGVRMGAFMDLTGLMDKLGVKTEIITSGRNKAMGDNYEPMTGEQRAILQDYVDESYEQFLSIVAKGRPALTAEEIRTLADGRIYSAQQAVDNGLIDALGSFDDALTTLRADYALESCEVRYVEKSAQQSLWQSLFYAAQELRPRTEIESALEALEALEGQNGYYCPIAR